MRIQVPLATVGWKKYKRPRGCYKTPRLRTSTHPHYRRYTYSTSCIDLKEKILGSSHLRLNILIQKKLNSTK